MTYNLHVDIRNFEGPYSKKTLSCLHCLVISYFKVCPFYLKFFLSEYFLYKKLEKKNLLLNYYMFWALVKCS